MFLLWAACAQHCSILAHLLTVIPPDAERRKIGITPGMIRISVGIEDPEDLIADFTEALKAFD